MITAIKPKFTVTHNSTELHIFHANTGEGLPRHQHQYNHLTMVHDGSIAIRKEGKEVIRTKDNQPVNLVANEWHEIEALEDGTVFVNVFAEGKQ
jgi:quercetin dioxygenase-like cupin family protein